MTPEKMIQGRFADSKLFRAIRHAGKLPAFQKQLRPCENSRRAVPQRIQARHPQQKRIPFRRQFRSRNGPAPQFVADSVYDVLKNFRIGKRENLYMRQVELRAHGTEMDPVQFQYKLVI